MISYRHIQLCHGLHYGVTTLVIHVLLIYWTTACDFLVVWTTSHLNPKQTCPGNPMVCWFIEQDLVTFLSFELRHI
jgi:hypothetical protein